MVFLGRCKFKTRALRSRSVSGDYVGNKQDVGAERLMFCCRNMPLPQSASICHLRCISNHMIALQSCSQWEDSYRKGRSRAGGDAVALVEAFL
eukprot:5422979-Amphidinium_carterae.1